MSTPFLQNKKLLPGFTHATAGFTLVEFIVIMAIFAIMVGVVLFNFTGFRSKITLDNLAQDIALSIRQVQASAGASISTDEPTTEIPQGIYFPVENGVYAKKFILFRDDVTDGLFGDGDTLIDTINIQTPDVITAVWYGNSIDESDNQMVAPLGITFKRFKTEATFVDTPLELTATAGVVRIQVTSPDGKRIDMITVSRLGQVSVQSITVPEDNSTPIIPANPVQ